MAYWLCEFKTRATFVVAAVAVDVVVAVAIVLLLLSLHLTLVSLLGKAAATFACLLHFNQFQSVAFRISLLGFGFCVFAAAVAALRYARSSALLLCGVCFQFVYAKCDVSIIYF